ncbi:LOW QUALITY PROTEIN: putative tubulin polyglutamylase TTLL2 [Urocitellus parryii]
MWYSLKSPECWWWSRAAHVTPSIPGRSVLLQSHGSERDPSLKTEDEPPGATLKPLVFRVDETTPEVVQNVLLEHLGWGFDEQEQNVEDWNLYWRTSSFRMIEHINVKPWQRLSLHPGMTKLTRKDRLAKHLQHMQRMYGTTLEFMPQIVMPNDYTNQNEYFKEKQMLGTKHGHWICKPEPSRGRGIIIVSDVKDLIFSDTYKVRKYICNPLLVSRYSDLRLVCVTGFKPLTIVYQEGLVWFATEKLDLHNLKNYYCGIYYAHLTNSSIIKSGVPYEKIKEVVGHSCKWTLSRFFSYLRNGDVDDLLLWQKINNVVILTVLAAVPSVPFAANCFELFGFDILIDDNLTWLLEVNHSPTLSLDCPTGVKRKLTDIIELICFNGLRAEGRECWEPQPPLFQESAPSSPDHAGNLVLIFPFNEATLGASGNGPSVKRTTQELQKPAEQQPKCRK